MIVENVIVVVVLFICELFLIEKTVTFHLHHRHHLQSHPLHEK
jgi:hypothetical protein